MSEGLKGVSVVVTAVADDENGDRDSEGSSVKQQAVSSDSFIFKNLSIAEVEISPFFFSEEHEPKNDLLVPRLGSLSSGCILGRICSFFPRITKVFVYVTCKIHSKETNHL